MKHLYLPFTLTTLLLAYSFSVAQDPNSEFHLDETYTPDVDGRIHLSTDDADIFIIGTRRNDVHVKIDRVLETRGVSWGSKRFEVDVEVRGGNLYIEDRESGSVGMVGYYKEEYVIRIEAPRSMALSIRGDDDDYEISGIDGAIKMDIDDGDAELEDCKGSDFRFDVDDGDIFLKGGRGSLVVQADDGDIHISDAAFDDIDAGIDDGDLYIETALSDAGGYRFRIEDGSLDLVVLRGGGTFDIRHDDGSVRYDSSFELIEEDDDFTSLRLAGGNASVRATGDDLGIRLSSDKMNN